MKKILTMAAAIAAVAMWAAPKAEAASLTIGDANYLGYIYDGIPSSDANEVAFINFLIGMAPGTVNLAPSTGTVVDAEDFFRSVNALCWPGCPTAVITDGVKVETGVNTGIPGGYTYLFAKYDGPNYGVAVWYVAGLTGPIDIPLTANGFELSHYSLYNPGTPCVDCDPIPEPASLMLLGVGLAAVAVRLRRRRTA